MRKIAQFVGKTDRLPKAAQMFAVWRIGSDLGDFRGFGGHLAMQVNRRIAFSKNGLE
jgi:hypothetical protein